MLKIYGNMLCPDCVACCEALDASGVQYEFLNIGDSLPNLKAFLAIRDGSKLFDEVRSQGAIGIPCLVDGEKISLSWEAYVTQADA